MHGFTRTVYNNGYKYTMVYPPGWRNGDPRRPEVHKEPWVPGPSDPRVANYFDEPWSYPERFGIPDRQPRSSATRSCRFVGARSGAERGVAPKGVQRAQETAWSHSLRAYLAQAWLPKYELGTLVDPSVRYEWPSFRALVRVPRTRKLYLVQRIFEWELRRAILLLKEALGDRQLTSALAEEGRLADLTLPDTAVCALDEHDAQFLDRCCLNGPSDVTKLVQAYPVRTIIKAIKLFIGIPDDHLVCARLKFSDVNHLCPVRNAGLFDLIALPGNEPDDLSLLIMVVSPRDIMYDDLEEFTDPGVPGMHLDLLDDDICSPYNILRAVIWDVCLAHHCRYFVLTSYDEWVFGTFSSDMHRARVTRHLHAPMFARDTSVSAGDITQARFPVPNVFELLLLWILAAGDDEHVWWPQPPDMPEPVHPSKLSIVDGGYADLETGL